MSDDGIPLAHLLGGDLTVNKLIRSNDMRLAIYVAFVATLTFLMAHTASAQTYYDPGYGYYYGAPYGYSYYYSPYGYNTYYGGPYYYSTPYYYGGYGSYYWPGRWDRDWGGRRAERWGGYGRWR
jgi:hypothetical protein